MSSTQNDLTDAQLVAFQMKKSALFKGTIAVCVVYGVFALGLLAIALYDGRGRQLLSEDFLPFTITFVAGMIVVIILLVIQVTSFKPQRLQTILYDREVCPDYWKAIPAAGDDIPSETSDTSNKQLMKIKCVPDPDVFAMDYKWDTGKFAQITSATADGTTTNVFGHKVKNAGSAGSTYDASKNKYMITKPEPGSDDTLTEKLNTVSTTMYGNVGIGTNTAGAMRCDVLFPALMAKEDELYDPENPNRLRCKYAELCGINWSSICSS